MVTSLPWVPVEPSKCWPPGRRLTAHTLAAHRTEQDKNIILTWPCMNSQSHILLVMPCYVNLVICFMHSKVVQWYTNQFANIFQLFILPCYSSLIGSYFTDYKGGSALSISGKYLTAKSSPHPPSCICLERRKSQAFLTSSPAVLNNDSKNWFLATLLATCCTVMFTLILVVLYWI